MESITVILNTHLNLAQNMIVNTTTVFVSLETVLVSSLSNKVITPFNGVHIHVPAIFISNISKDQSVSLRVSYITHPNF